MNRSNRRALPSSRGDTVDAYNSGNGRYDTRHDPRASDQGMDYGSDMGGAGGMGGSMTGGGTHPNLFKLVHRLLRGRYILTLVLAGSLAIVGAIFGFSSTRPMFRTTGTVRVQSQASGLSGYGGGGNSMQFIATQAALMRNDRVLQLAMDHEDWKALGIGTGLEAQEELRDSLDIFQVPGSTELIEITSTHRESKFTKAAVNSILRAFSLFGLKNDQRIEEATSAAFRDRKNQSERTIRELQDQILELTKQFGTSNLTTAIEQKTLQINEYDAQINSLTTRLAELPDRPEGEPPPLTPDPSATLERWSPQEIAKVDATMAEYVREESDRVAYYETLRKRLSDQHTAVKRAADAVAQIRIKIERHAEQWTATPELKNQVRVLSEGNPDKIRTERQKKTEARDALVTERSLMNQTQQKIDALTSQMKFEEGNLSNIQRDIDQIAMAQRINTGSGPTGRMEIISDGSTPLRPSVDRRKQYAAAGFVLGGGMPVVAMLLLGLIDRRFRYSDDATDTGTNAPLLGILPILPPDVRDEERREMAAHCVHNIRVLLQLSGEVGGAKVFAVTSPTAGDGKTSLVLSLGLSFAASGSRTVLVDFDTVGTGLSASLDVRGVPGVLEAIRTGQTTGCVHPSGVDENLFIIPASPGDDIHVSRVSTSSVRRLVSELHRQFDTVLIDTGPILGSIEASLAAAQADGVILVVGRGQHHSYIKRAVDRISAVGGRLAGMVFNRATANDFRRSVSAASVRSVPRGLPPGPSSRTSGLHRASPIVSTVAPHAPHDPYDPDRRAAS